MGCRLLLRLFEGESRLGCFGCVLFAAHGIEVINGCLCLGDDLLLDAAKIVSCCLCLASGGCFELFHSCFYVNHDGLLRPVFSLHQGFYDDAAHRKRGLR